jgi:hypothetical protein
MCLITQAAFHKGVWDNEGKAPVFLTWALYGGEWSVSRPSRFNPREAPPGVRFL